MTAVAAAAMIAAIVVTIVMVFAMVTAPDIGVVVQFTGNECLHSGIGFAGHTTIQLNACCRLANQELQPI